MSVTDGNLTTDGAAQSVRVIGTVTTTGSGGTVSSTQGTPAATANAWPITVTDGTNTAVVVGSSAGVGSALVTTTGSITAQTSLNALTAVGPGVVVDFGSARNRITAVTTAAGGVTAGATTLMVSHDSSNWIPGTAQTFTANGSKSDTVTGAFRYGRVDITTTVTGGTVSATLMAS
jgi:hypothetical protein